MPGRGGVLGALARIAGERLGWQRFRRIARPGFAELPPRVVFVLGDTAAGTAGACSQSGRVQLACKFNSNEQTTIVCRQP